MFVSALAGIEIFATGGIGGVHRGAAETFDISADLIELSRSKVAVVCAGAKSILEHRQDAGVSGIAGRADHRLSLRRISGLFRAHQRREARPSLRRRA